MPGLDRVATLDSTSIMERDSVPEHLLVLGSGYVGLEFGQLFRRLGSQVTIIQRGNQLLAREDPDVAEAVADILRQDGVDVLLQTDAVRAEQSNGAIQLTVEVDESRGFMKADVDADSNQILGYACLGIEGGELMNMVEIAMLGKLPYTVL